MGTLQAQSFDLVIEAYAEARVGYPDSLYKEIEKFAKFDRESKILELGSGTGIATDEINNHWKPQITALEPGKKLYKVVSDRFKQLSNVILVNSPFETFTTEDRYDGIFSATAFHWIDKKVKYQKTYELLNDNGLLVLYWNNYLVLEETYFDALQNIYKKFHPKTTGDKDIRLIQKEKILNRISEILDSGLFSLLSHKEFISNIEYTTGNYIKLLQSFSDNSILTGIEMELFYRAIKDLIDSNGGKINVQVLTNCEIAKKRHIKSAF